MKNLNLRYYLAVLVIVLTGYNSYGQASANEIIHLGDKREIFVDHYLIDKLEGTRLVMNHPHDEGPVLFFDDPWEGPFCGYVTIINDDGKYRAYYRGWNDLKDRQVTCYAESDNGRNWVKPELGLVEYNGSKKNNIILDVEPETHNFCPFIDTKPNVPPSQKYKALGGSGKSGLIPYVSSDGIHWEKLHNEGVIKKGAFDSQNVAFWSEQEKLYLCYFRVGADGFRSVSRSTSKDFINWSEPVAMTYGDTPREHLYTQQTSPYFRAPHIYVAIGARFVPQGQVLSIDQLEKLNVAPSQHKGMSDAFFMTTRGGNIYDRTFMESFIRPGTGLRNWSARTNYPALNVVQTGEEEMSVYVNKDYAQPSAYLRRYSLRLDGFTSVSAPFEGGEVITKSFTFSGNKLEINYSTSVVGAIKFEIQDQDGNPVPGYTLEDCQPVTGDEISRVVSWNQGNDLKNLNSKTVRLRIFMKDADLYSIKFTNIQ